MNRERFDLLTRHYPETRIAVVGDFCLDRYLEIDPDRREVSIETDLPIYNVARVRSQPGAAGTILSNLAALGIGRLFPVGFAGSDGEGFELQRALENLAAVRLGCFQQTDLRRTFTYTKPLLREPGKPPVELNRFDFKNWTPTPEAVQEKIVDAIANLTPVVDAMVLLDQVDLPDTGVITPKVLDAVTRMIQTRPDLLVIADSRRGFKDFPPATLKMNRRELASLAGAGPGQDLAATKEAARNLARSRGQPVVVTLAESGILGASPAGDFEHLAAYPVRGPIDVVGAGDAVTANLAAALAAGATLHEALEIANAAASIVLHQLGTTGTASVPEIGQLLFAKTAYNHG